MFLDNYFAADTSYKYKSILSFSSNIFSSGLNILLFSWKVSITANMVKFVPCSVVMATLLLLKILVLTTFYKYKCIHRTLRFKDYRSVVDRFYRFIEICGSGIRRFVSSCPRPEAAKSQVEEQLLPTPEFMTTPGTHLKIIWKKLMHSAAFLLTPPNLTLSNFTQSAPSTTNITRDEQLIPSIKWKQNFTMTG